ncbi:uncharacterized protein A4U43_C03F8420 [Asparagus officinalis]|uniref:F-box domain-containing protein n=1 Tax=Asparagus officinalis TaxID=4686 RepID=A0A5P1F8H4_ASPOF|nr:F-box protein At1g61340-like [Asparagus officinalis]XP_020256427.1 F-box protein At1g61340-like [Asparagus officinalis]XP_020256428.1 F-box protein At1g61340-like [Asparagus officinalis]ONK74625.1 uncharacterized protein A4U43_C03F8420 [Asparagus officinalis]
MALKVFQCNGSDHQKPIELVTSTRILGRKRILVLNKTEAISNLSSPFSTPLPKRRGRRVQSGELNRLESLPQDLLVRILCKVTHEDLKQLLLVSKCVNEAALTARNFHFAYTTPRTKPVFRKDDDSGVDDFGDSRDVPNAPIPRRMPRSRINFEIDSIAVNLFSAHD